MDVFKNVLTNLLPSKKVLKGLFCLGLPYTPYAGSVSIKSSADDGGTWDLRYYEEEEVRYAKVSFFLFFLYAVRYGWQKIRIRIERSSLSGKLPMRNADLDVKLVLGIILLIVHYQLFFTSPQIAPDKFTTIFLSLLVVVSYLCLSFGSARRFLGKYMTRGKIVLASVIALYASFASFGQRFFLDGNTRMHVSAQGAFYVALGTVWFIPVIYLLLFGLEWLASLCRPRSKSVCRHKIFWVLWAILCLCQVVILWNFWPGGFPADTIDQINQAVRHGIIANWQPAINTILYRIILDICPHAGALVAVQLFFFALICTKFLMLGYDYGISFKALAILGIVFSLLPNQVLFGISPLKDYPYTLSLLWATYLLVRLSLNLKELERLRFRLAMALSLFLIYAFRHNGIVPFVAVLLLFVWITIRHFAHVKYRLAVVSLLSLLLIDIYKGPVFSWFQVTDDIGMSPYITMLCAVASCANKNLPLSDESAAIMESALPIDQWAAYYDRYAGHDPYYWGRGELANEHPFNPSIITAKEAFTVYLEALRKYPDVVIKDRLDGMDLLWDVRQPPDSFNVKCFISTTLSEGDLAAPYLDFGPMEPGESYYNNSSLLKSYRSAIDTASNSVFDILLWRSGAYLILLMTLGLFWWGNRMKRFFWVAMPLLGQTAGLILVLYHQSYRYISAVQILTLALTFCSFLPFSYNTDTFIESSASGEIPPSTDKTV